MTRGAAGDHPRTRGVYVVSVCERPSVAGSSPHTRGLLLASLVCLDCGGIIPAHAGFTAGILYVRDRRKDHPRTRGVYPSGSVGAGQAAGSSPHTRGLLVPLLPREAGPRIIPAHAGFT